MKYGVPECPEVAIEFHEKGLHVILCREHWRQAIAYSLESERLIARLVKPIPSALICALP